MTVRIEHTTTSGTFSLDGQTFDVDNNVWLLGDDAECAVIDAPHDVDVITKLIGGRRVVAVLATHAHDDHVRVAPELAAATDAPVLLHPDDLPVWRLTHPEREPDGELRDGQVLEIAGLAVHVLHTPGHAPGACCFHVPALGVVFTGDTLFQGGPGATGRSFSDHDTILASIRTRLLTLPGETVVHTGHGPSTTIAAEAAALG
ncbi:MBL fold metallo-hydrolase [Kutzneria albida]|uniref:Hydrolase n=1 Tax=Kutzneria albida DSM 43870 TaxID=1449976 RepID=W5W697_9PSEU|nr:MBL fold metallo-hydrolase [Kutzneria albida]AHH96285.1 hydrolase [Kutzneria albida DSM 43870]